LVNKSPPYPFAQPARSGGCYGHRDATPSGTAASAFGSDSLKGVFLTFVIVFGLIGVTAWAARSGSGRLGGALRRQPRLVV
jgi:hypothetical protein